MADKSVGEAVGAEASVQSTNTTGQLLDALAQEVQSAAPNAFGSPHVSSPAPPLSPLDGAAKLLDFEGAAKAATPVPAQSPPTPTMQPLSPAPVAAAANKPLPATPITPAPAAATGGAAASTSSNTGTTDVDYSAFVEDTLLWVNKVRSVVYLLGGLLLIYLVDCLLNSGVTLVTGVCWVLLGQAALNFVRGFINPKLQARCTWQDSALTSLLTSTVSNAARSAAALHDKHMAPADAGKLLRIVVVLWAVSLAGRLAGATGLAATLWVLAFSVPKVYLLNKTKVDKLASDTLTQAKGHFVKLDAKVRAAIIVVPTFVLGYLLSRVDLAIALLCVALYGRSLMAQSQVDKVNAAVAPVSTTVSKVGGTVGGLVQSAVVRYDLTPTPAKKKRQ